MRSHVSEASLHHELARHVGDGNQDVQLWISEGKGWARAAASRLNCNTEGLRDLYMDALLQGSHQKLSDFDDHLNDISK